jgi:hypothetical protein
MPPKAVETNTTNEIIPTVFIQSVLQLLKMGIGVLPGGLVILVFTKVARARMDTTRVTRAIKIRTSPIILDIPHLRGGNNEYYKLPSKCVNSKAIPLHVGRGI